MLPAAVPRASPLPVLVLALVLALVAGACGGSGSPPEAVEDPGAAAVGEEVPAWFPANVRPPAGSVVVEVIDDPAPDFGRTVTWRAAGDFDDVVGHFERLLAGLGWGSTDEAGAEGVEGSRNRTWLLRNDSVFSIRVYEDESLEGVRVSVELPAR